MTCSDRWILVSLFGAALLSPPAFAAASPVEATVSYRQAFGPPPRVEGGTCLAAVVFLPGVGSSGAPDKLSPLPLFVVSPGKVLEEAARVLVEGHPREARELKLPRLFPEGSRLLGVRVDGASAAVGVEPGGPGPVHPLAVQALAHTLSQFNGIGSVILEIRGRAPVGPETPRAVVEAPPSPRLLDVVAPARKGEKPSEIDVLFDRPVEVVMISMRGATGRLLHGTTYASMFDMAVVFHPDDPKEIRDDLPLEIRWSVRDRFGRKADGTRSIPLRTYAPPD